MKGLKLLFCFFFGIPTFGQKASNLSPVNHYNGIFIPPPCHVPTEFMEDGPLLGNGDAAVVMAGPVEEMRFFIGKNDFWGRVLPRLTVSTEELEDGSTNFAHTKNAGKLIIEIPALRGGTYRQEQSLALAEVSGTFTKDNLIIHSRVRVDANKNLLITELSCEGIETDFFIKQIVKTPYSQSSNDVVIVRGKYPMLHVLADADEVVPAAENTIPFELAVKKLNGDITVIHKPGFKHHPHSPPDHPTPIVDFILRATKFE